MAKPCSCTTKDGKRFDKDDLPMWLKMEGCPACDWKIYTPDTPIEVKEKK